MIDHNAVLTKLFEQTDLKELFNGSVRKALVHTFIIGLLVGYDNAKTVIGNEPDIPDAICEKLCTEISKLYNAANEIKP